MITFKQFLAEWKKFETEDHRIAWGVAKKKWKGTLAKVHALYGGFANVRGFLYSHETGSMIDVSFPEKDGWTREDFQEEVLKLALSKFFKDDDWDIEIGMMDQQTDDDGVPRGMIAFEITLHPRGETLALLKTIPSISGSYAHRKRRK